MKCAAILKKFKKAPGTTVTEGDPETLCCSKGIRSGVTIKKQDNRVYPLCGGTGHTVNDNPAVHSKRGINTGVIEWIEGIDKLEEKMESFGDIERLNRERKAEAQRVLDAQLKPAGPIVQAWLNKEVPEVTEEKDVHKDLYIIGFTGHRPNKLGGYGQVNPLRAKVKKAMEQKVRAAIEKFSATHEIVIVTGGALGVDQWAAALANHLNLRHAMIIPFKHFDSQWPQSSRTVLNELKATTDVALALEYASMLGVLDDSQSLEEGVIYVGTEYSREIYQKRNEWMVDVSTAMIAVWNGDQTGGTANCVGYIRAQNKPMVHINPREL